MGRHAMKTKCLLLAACGLWFFGFPAHAQRVGSTPGAASHTSINNVIYADTQPGVTADAKINACIAALPGNGGICDARGFGSTSQTIAAKVIVGTNSKTVTLRIDRTTTFHCTITNGADPCFDLGPGSAVIGDGGVVTLPNAGITFASNANVVAAVRNVQQEGGNFVGAYIEGLTIVPNTTMTVTDAIVSLQNPLQITHIKNLTIGGSGVAGILLKLYCTKGKSCGNVEFDNIQIDCFGGASCKPIWIGCTGANSTALGSCGGIFGINFQGPSAITHPGPGGIPIFDVEGGNGAGGCNPIEDINWYGVQLESRNTDDIGILLNGVNGSAHVYGLVATANTHAGADVIRIAQPGGCAVDGIDIRGVSNQGSWTNTLNNTINRRTFTPAGGFARLNYSYSGRTRIQNIVDGGPVSYGGVTFANLGTPANGAFTFCSDCTITNPCAARGTGAFAKRLNGIWVCN
jgi:hypothetical protein